ncbi:MAG: ATP-binding cassette domain-containing protein [Acidimicrobiales bacterium]
MTGTATTMLDAQVVVRREAYTLDVAVRADAGDVVAVLGPNGAGKSTLLAALAGLVAIDGGHVVVDGATLDDPVASVLIPPERRGVSLVPQDLVLFTHLDARANVAFGLRARDRPAPRRCHGAGLARPSGRR